MISTSEVGVGALEIEGRSVPRLSARPSVREACLQLLVGTGFGILLVESQAASWYRIYEMFRFESFHMFGVIGAALASAALGIALLRGLGVRTMDGDEIVLPVDERPLRPARYALGGAIFGLGWGLLGACPGPMFVWIGAGVPVYVVPIAAALAGTWAYGALRPRLPH